MAAETGRLSLSPTGQQHHGLKLLLRACRSSEAAFLQSRPDVRHPPSIHSREQRTSGKRSIGRALPDSPRAALWILCFTTFPTPCPGGMPSAKRNIPSSLYSGFELNHISTSAGGGVSHLSGVVVVVVGVTSSPLPVDKKAPHLLAAQSAKVMSGTCFELVP